MTTAHPVATVEIDFTTDLSAGLAYYEQVAASGPYVWYRLQEAAGTSHVDASGNAVTGTGSGLTLNQTAGKPVSGETASRYVNFGNRISFPPPSLAGDRITLEAWVYRSTLSGSDSTYYYIFAGTNGVKLGFFVRGDGRLQFTSSFNTLLDPVQAMHYTTNAVISAATWYHVAAAADGPNSNVQFYVNGAAVATTNTQSLPFDLATPSTAYWGTNLAGGATPVSRIAEPAMYLRTLSASEISDHYAAATTTPFAGYTWTDVTDYVLFGDGLTRSFGRETNLDEVVPMETTFTLVNDNREFEPENPDSPYYPNVVPGRPVRIQMTQNAVTYDWAFGFIADFPQLWDRVGRFGRVPIVAHDFLERMNQEDIGIREFTAQLAGGRVDVLLNAAGQPQAMRDIDAGAFTLTAQTADSGTVGGYVLQVARSDRGVFYFDGAGDAIFQDGDARSTDTRSTVVQGTIGNTGQSGQIPYWSPEFHSPRSLIRNEITLRRPGGVDQVAVDQTSRIAYGKRSYQDELLLETDADIAARAAALLADYKDPTLRVRKVTFNPVVSPGWWEDALGVRVSDLYQWVFWPQQGDPITRAVFVEGVQDEYRDKEYLSTWFLSVAAPVGPPAAGSFRGLLALTS